MAPGVLPATNKLSFSHRACPIVEDRRDEHHRQPSRNEKRCMHAEAPPSSRRRPVHLRKILVHLREFSWISGRLSNPQLISRFSFIKGVGGVRAPVNRQACPGSSDILLRYKHGWNSYSANAPVRSSWPGFEAHRFPLRVEPATLADCTQEQRGPVARSQIELGGRSALHAHLLPSSSSPLLTLRACRTIRPWPS